jgi:hypothetical protein
MKYEIKWQAAHRRLLAQAKEQKLCLRSSTDEENDARSGSTGNGKRKARTGLTPT